MKSKVSRLHHTMEDSTHEAMKVRRDQAVIKRIVRESDVIHDGAGNKILAAALGEVACSMQHRIGGPWDLCAPKAVWKSMGLAAGRK